MDRSISLPLSLSLFCSTGLFFHYFFNVFICPQQRSPLTKQASVHQAKVSSWLQSSEGMDKCSRGQSAYVTTAVSSSTYSSFTSAPSGRCELKISSFSSISLLKDLDECESYLLELNLLLKSMEVLHRTYSAPAISGLQVSTQRERRRPLNPPPDPPELLTLLHHLQVQQRRCVIYFFLYHRPPITSSPRRRRDRGSGDPKITARKPNPPCRCSSTIIIKTHTHTHIQHTTNIKALVWGCVCVAQVPSCISSQSPRLHASNPNLSTSDSTPQDVSPDSPDSPVQVSRLQEDFCRLANNGELRLLSEDHHWSPHRCCCCCC